MKILKFILFPVIAVAITAGALWYTSRSISPKKATWEDVLAEAKNGGYRIISNEELWNLYSANPKNIFLVDTRQEWEYRTGHIKSAVNFPMEPTRFSRWRKKGDLEALLGSDKDRLIVFY